MTDIKKFALETPVVVWNSPNEEANGLVGVIVGVALETENGIAYIVMLQERLKNGNLAEVVNSKYLFDPNKEDLPEKIERKKESTTEVKTPPKEISFIPGTKIACAINSAGIDAVGTIEDVKKFGNETYYVVELDFMVDRKEKWYGEPWPVNYALIPEKDIKLYH